MNEPAFHNGIECIDHPVIAAHDLDAARHAFTRLGFTVPPRGSHVEWGTGNLCIMFPDDYLEVRGILDASRFTMHLDEHLERFGEGPMGVAFGTSDVASSRRAARANGVSTGELRRLTRNFEHPEGWTQPSFALYAPAAADIGGLMHVVVIEHLTPDLIRAPGFLQHRNGCTGVNGLAGSIHDIPATASRMRRLLGDAAVVTDAGGVQARLPTGQFLDLCTPDAFVARYGPLPFADDGHTARLAAVILRVADIAVLASVLDNNGVPYERLAGSRVRVPATRACGTVLEFVDRDMDH